MGGVFVRALDGGVLTRWRLIGVRGDRASVDGLVLLLSLWKNGHVKVILVIVGGVLCLLRPTAGGENKQVPEQLNSARKSNVRFYVCECNTPRKREYRMENECG